MKQRSWKRIALNAALVVGLVGPAAAGARESGLQLSPDGRQTLVSKDVGDQRWAIVRTDDGTVSGNVFFTDGGAPLFVWCEPRPGAPDDTVALSCFGADACPVAPCDENEWDFIADVDLPGSFFSPPASPEPTPTGTPTVSPSPGATPSPAATPGSTSTPGSSATPSASATPTGSSTPTGTSSPGTDDDIRCCVPDDGGTDCEDRTPAECIDRGGVNLGPGSCNPNPCS